MADIQIINAERDSITFDEMLKIGRWSFGSEGETLAKLWQAFNILHFDEKLTPLPIWQIKTFPYGKASGLFTASDIDNQSLFIQIKYGMTLQEKANTLLHEMIHQSLSEKGLKVKHNALPWCGEIMRLSRDIWNQDIWASPAIPTRRAGTSTRLQKPSPTGQVSITRNQISTWPQSLNLDVPFNDYL